MYWQKNRHIWNIIISMFSFMFNHLEIKDVVFFHNLRISFFDLQIEQVLLQEAHHVVPPCSYSSLERTNQILALKMAFRAFSEFASNIFSSTSGLARRSIVIGTLAKGVSYQQHLKSPINHGTCFYMWPVFFSLTDSVRLRPHFPQRPTVQMW